MLILAGCAMSGQEYLEYTGDAFCASIYGRMNGVEFAAEVKIGAPRAYDSGRTGAAPRDIEMVFQSPATLSGIKITRKDSKVTVSSGSVEIDGSGCAGWLAAAELLIPDGAIDNVSIITENGERLAEVRMILDGGTPLTLYVDCNTGFPVSVKCGDYEIRVAAFGEADRQEKQNGALFQPDNT